MRRRVGARILLASALLALACTDQNLPTQPSQFSTAPYDACTSAFAALITSQINTLYPNTPAPSLRNAALSRLSSIIKQCSKNPADAEKKAVQLAGFAVDKFLSGKLVTGTTWEPVSLHIDYLYQYVGLDAPSIPQDAVGADAILVVVAPGDAPRNVITGDGLAGAHLETDAFSATQTVLFAITPNPTCEPFPNTLGLEEFPPCYIYETWPDLPKFNKDVGVGICTNIGGLSSEQAGRLQLAHGRRPDRTELELLPRFDADFLGCASYVPTASKGFLGRLAARALALFGPQHLHAATLLPGGLGGQTDNFQVFQAVDPGKLVFTEQPTSTPANMPITPAVQVTRQREDGSTIPAGSTDTVTLAIGTNPSGGTLSGITQLPLIGGVATFNNLSIDQPGTGYTLIATGTSSTGAVLQPVTSAAFDITSTTTLIDCGGAAGGDQISRGFYVPGFPGTTLDRVTLHFSSNTAGSYTLSLTARDGTYDGTILGTSNATVTLTANGFANVPTTFTFPSPAVTEGSTVTFSIGLVSGPDVVFYSVAASFAGDPTCPVFETEGTNPPLDTPRRQGVQVKIEGSP